MADSRINLYSPVVHDDQDVLLRDHARDEVLRSGERKRYIRIGVISLVLILIVALVGGIIGALISKGTVAPIIPVTTTTQRPTTSSSTTTTTEKPTTSSSTTTTTEKPTTSTTTKITTTHGPEPFPPPTKHPFPADPGHYTPVNLLIDMGMNPEFADVPCTRTKPPVYKCQVTVAGHTFTSDGADRIRDAKTGAAMAANEAIFKFKYPVDVPFPHPHTPCNVTLVEKA